MMLLGESTEHLCRPKVQQTVLYHLHQHRQLLAISTGANLEAMEAKVHQRNPELGVDLKDLP